MSVAQHVPRIAFVTGGARRLGRATALKLAGDGWDVAIHCHRSLDAAQATAADIRALGRRCIVLQADLGDEGMVERLIPAICSDLGAPTCLVNNASVFEMDKIETVTRDSWDRHMETNLRAPFVLSQALARHLPEGAQGNIVNMLDQRVWKLTPYFMSYTVAKMGLWTLTRTMALALAPRIRVNAVGPGPTLPSPRQTPEHFAAQSAAMPLGHGATPEEIADTILYILSASAMTGQMIALDGGEHLGWQVPNKGFQPKE
ncbi:SDR family oxidoreductase [Dongia sp.]|uniref:SDR family oxidoreductase n=1 Tax=Dongia sp. TaxID=1977262 RepID=UPI0035AF2F61